MHETNRIHINTLQIYLLLDLLETVVLSLLLGSSLSNSSAAMSVHVMESLDRVQNAYVRLNPWYNNWHLLESSKTELILFLHLK